MQGDHTSPFLFDLIGEGLACVFHKALALSLVLGIF